MNNQDACPICLESYRRNPDKHLPRLLSCGHCICNGCLDLILKKSVIECPLCRKISEYSSANSAPIAFNLLAILETNCSECPESDPSKIGNGNCEHCGKWICLKCKKLHLDKVRENVLKLLEEIKIETEICSKKSSIHVNYETTVLENTKICQNKYRDLIDSKNDLNKQVSELIQLKQDKLKELLEINNELNSKLDEINKTIQTLNTIDNFRELSSIQTMIDDYSKFNLEKKNLVENKIETENPLRIIQEKLSTMITENIFDEHKDMKKFDTNDITKKVKDQLEKDKDISLCIAGRVNAGKSQLINALRNIRNWEKGKGAALVKNYECTKIATPYTIEKNEYTFHFWDTPGFGTNSMLIEEYAELLINLDCDAYIYLFKDAFTSDDTYIIEKIKQKKPVFLARTNADVDFEKTFESLAECDYRTASDDLKSKYKKNVLQEINKSNEEEINKNKELKFYKTKSKIYHISSDWNYKNEFDLSKLQNDIHESLPKDKKMSFIILAKTNGLQILEQKYTALKKYIRKKSKEAAWRGLIPFINTNAYNKKIDETIKFFISTFDLNPESYERANFSDKLQKKLDKLDNERTERFESIDEKMKEYLRDEKKDAVTFGSVAKTVPILVFSFVIWPWDYFEAIDFLEKSLDECYRKAKQLFERSMENIEIETQSS